MKIKNVTITQKDEVFQLIMDCRKAMEEEGVFQWTDQYPTLKIISNDRTISIIKNKYTADKIIHL